MENGENVLGVPFHTEAADTTDNKVSAFDGLFHLLNLVIFHTCGEILNKLGVTAGSTAGINDLAIQRCTNQADSIAVFSRGESQGRTHHTGTDNSNCFHRKHS